MAHPNIPSRKPVVLTLEPGEYLWCTCGLSKNQPFCDDSHVGGEFMPLKFTVKNKKQFLMCNCKFAASKPFCDGTHNYLV